MDPPRGYLQIVLDGEGSEVTFGEGNDPSSHGETAITVVHVPQSSASAWQPNRGMLALYMPVDGSHKQLALVDFVAWGAPARGGWTRRDLGQVWPVTSYVTLQETSGIYDPETTLRPGESIGLLPGAGSGIPGNWAVYSRDEITPGSQNPLPRPRFFTPPSGAAVKHEDLKIAWKRRFPGERYQIEISNSLDFSTGVQSFDLDAPIFRSEGRIEPGKYVYRVRRFAAIPETPAEPSAWSEAMAIEAAVTPCGNAGAFAIEMHTVLDESDFRGQTKDTRLLCLNRCLEANWDKPHHIGGVSQSCKTAVSDEGNHGSEYCVPASIAMMVAHFDKCLSQDRITYFNRDCPLSPDGDLAHQIPWVYSRTPCPACGLPLGGEITEAMMWALGVDNVLDINWLHFIAPGLARHIPPNTIGFTHDIQRFQFSLVRGWLDDDRPIMSRTNPCAKTPEGVAMCKDHMTVLAGYCVSWSGAGFPRNWVRVFDPLLSGGDWQEFETWKMNTWGIWVGPQVAPNVREDEDSIWTDADNDGIMDFDEIHRFMTLHTDPDADDDGVGDREDILGYVIHRSEDTSEENIIDYADWDGDGLRMEIDPDNDNDGCLDGVEDADGDGTKDPGETSNFDASDSS